MARKKRNSGFKLILVLMTLIMAYFGYTIVGQLLTIKDLEDQVASKEVELQELQILNKSLEKEIEESDSLSFIERIARDEYGLVKPKEIIFIDRDKEDK